MNHKQPITTKLNPENKIFNENINKLKFIFERIEQPKTEFNDLFIVFKVKSNEVFYEEFQKRLKDIINEDSIKELWNKLIDSLEEKNIEKAKEFLLMAQKKGLEPLYKSGEKIFWSGDVGKRAAMEEGRKGTKNVLEISEIGSLLDGLKLWEHVPWNISSIIWTLVSRLFAIGAEGKVHVYCPDGLTVGNVFWNDELPVLRRLQLEGYVLRIVMHIWDSEEKTYLPEMDIQSDKLRFAYDKRKKDKKGNWYKFEKPFKVKTLRDALIKNNDPNRRASLILYYFRLETGVFAKMGSQPNDSGFQIEFSEYGKNQNKYLDLIYINSKQEVFQHLPSIEKFLMANYKSLSEMPNKILYIDSAFVGDNKIIALKYQEGRWIYNSKIKDDILQVDPAIAKYATDELKKHKFQFELFLTLHTFKNETEKLHHIVSRLCDQELSSQIQPKDRVKFIRLIGRCNNTVASF